MRSFKIPYDIKHEEKIFNGYLSLRQFAYCILALASTGFLFIKINWILRILLFTVSLPFFICCAFLTLNGVNFDKFLIYYFSYLKNKKNKNLIYKK